MMHCSNCGHELRDGAKFCDNCGQQVHQGGSGDQITIRDIRDSTAVAVGRGAQASVTSGSGSGLTEEKVRELLADAFASVQQYIADRPELDTPQISEKIEEVHVEVVKFEQAVAANEEPDPSRLAQLGTALAKMAPDIVEVMVASLAGPAAAATVVLRKVLAKAREEADAAGKV